jgi:hypothetical protein
VGFAWYRERARVCREETVLTGRPHRAARERGRERACGLASIGGTRLSGTEGTQARARARGAWPHGATWDEIAFLFSREFLIVFLFIFSRVLNSNSNQV